MSLLTLPLLRKSITLTDAGSTPRGQTSVKLVIFASAEEAMFSQRCVCVCACMFVCVQKSSYWPMLMQNSEAVGRGNRQKF